MVLGNAHVLTTEIRGNVGIGTNTPAGRLHVSSNIVLTASPGDPAVFAGGGMIYSKANGTTNGLYCQDSEGNVTLLGTHEDLKHVAYSYNRFTGEGRSINLDALAEAVQQLTGRTDIVRKLTVPRADWDAEEAARINAERVAFERGEDAAEHEANAPVAAWDAAEPEDRKGPRPPVYVRRKYTPSAPRPKPQWLVDFDANRK